MAGQLKIKRREWDRLKKRLLRFDQRSMDVGIFREAKYGPEQNNLNIAQVAFMNDQGSRTNPPRPFLTVDFVAEANSSFPRKAKQFFLMLLFNRNFAFTKVMNELGEEYAFALQEIILDYPGSNSPKWIASKGFNDPLYHTGQMVESVRHRIKRRKS